MVPLSRVRAPPAISINLPLRTQPRQRRGRGHRRPWRRWRKHSANVHFARLQGEHPPVPYAACGRKIGGGAAERSVECEVSPQ